MAQQKPSPSMLDTLRASPVGALLAGLVTMFVAAALLSGALPDEPNLLTIILTILLGMAVGFGVRVATKEANVGAYLAAGLLSAVGYSMMTNTASANAVEGVEFWDAYAGSLGTDFFAIGSGIAAAAAVITVGWIKK